MSAPITVPPFPDNRPAKTGNPQTVTLYGAEHIGKTESVTKLPGTVKIIMLQPGGGDHLAGSFMDIHQLTDAGKFGKKPDGTNVDYDDAFYATLEWAVRENIAGKPIADFVVFDRIDRIEDWIFKRALKTFRSTLIGGSEKFKDLTSVTDVPGVGSQGSPGWKFVREEMRRTMDLMKMSARYVVLITGVRDKVQLSNMPKVAGEPNPNDLDLTGGLRKLVCNESSSFGFMYRDDQSNVRLNFKSSDKAVCGTYCQHLRGREFIIGKVNAALETLYDWSSIYLNEPPKP